ncbi:hypothetical protein TNCV_2916361 [Trichonephila clavipes]|nr:hypothetical protein TNCV_2916361 [Trichonephila clavipes]
METQSQKDSEKLKRRKIKCNYTVKPLDLRCFQISSIHIPPPIVETQAESVPKSDEIDSLIKKKKKKVVDLARQINLLVDSDDVQELLDSYNHEFIMEELIKIYEQAQGIEELESVDPVQ